VIAIASLAVAVLLEAILLLQGVQRARDTLTHAFAEDQAAAARVARRPVIGNITIGVLVALLGFGLLAAFILWRS
jgi:hypothetical protein